MLAYLQLRTAAELILNMSGLHNTLIRRLVIATQYIYITECSRLSRIRKSRFGERWRKIYIYNLDYILARL